jgi:DNA-binding HxlR family transcriptional regulator/putative sterol carrier protein
VKSYGQYCPIAKSVEVLGERWSILVLRELLIGSVRFNDIARGLPGMSRTMLSKRLREFESAGLIERLDGDYQLTPSAQELRPFVFGLGAWGEQWMLGEPDPNDLDPVTLMWHAHARMNTSDLPARRVVIEFQLDGRPERYWVVVEASGCSVCEADPGFDVDVTVTAALPDLYRVFYHQLDIAAAVKAGQLRFEGEKALVRRMPGVLDLLPPDLLGVDAASPRPTWRPPQPAR